MESQGLTCRPFGFLEGPTPRLWAWEDPVTRTDVRGTALTGIGPIPRSTGPRWNLSTGAAQRPPPWSMANSVSRVALLLQSEHDVLLGVSDVYGIH